MLAYPEAAFAPHHGPLGWGPCTDVWLHHLRTGKFKRWWTAMLRLCKKPFPFWGIATSPGALPRKKGIWLLDPSFSQLSLPPPSAHRISYSRQGVEEMMSLWPLLLPHMLSSCHLQNSKFQPPTPRCRDRKCPLVISTFWPAASLPWCNELRVAHGFGKGETAGEKCAKVTMSPHPR